VIVINEAMAKAFWQARVRSGTRENRFRDGATQWQHDCRCGGRHQNGGLDRFDWNGTLHSLSTGNTLPAVTNNFTFVAALIIRTSVDPASLAGAARSQVHGLDATVPVSEVKTMEDVMAQAVSRPRFVTLAMTLFSTLLWFWLRSESMESFRTP